MKIKEINPLADYYYNILAMLMTHDTLVRFGPDLDVVPQLAETWSCSKDGKIWKFRLVSDARWHDGYPVTAEDVKFTFNYLAGHNITSGWAADLIEDIRINGSEIIFRLKKPYSRFLINAGFIVRILPKHIWEKINDPQKAAADGMTIGCGPYIFNSFNREAGRIFFDVNNDYHGVIPKIGRIEFHLYQNMDILTMALIKNKVDFFYKYASGYPLQYIKQLEKTNGLKMLEADALGVPAALGFNLKHTPFDMIDVRKAISLAINYERITQCFLRGNGYLPGPGFVPPAFPFHKNFSDLTYTPGKSRKLLESCGFKDRDGDGILEFTGGNKISLDLLVRGNLPGNNQLVKLLTHDLEAVGLHIAVQYVDLSTWINFLDQDKYDLVLFRTTPWGMMMHAGYSSGYFDSRRKGGGVIGNISDPDFLFLCDQILSTTDTLILEQLYHDLQSYYARHLPAIPLCWSKNIYPFHENRQGFKINQLEGGLANRFSWNSLEPSLSSKSKDSKTE
ncbi:ABC transporter substrate-binding protein [Desulfosarcina sp. BuS5]|nr:ABC transporter substrate-binding protein [Desulfosarcina sp. BuS5]